MDRSEADSRIICGLRFFRLTGEKERICEVKFTPPISWIFSDLVRAQVDFRL